VREVCKLVREVCKLVREVCRRKAVPVEPRVIRFGSGGRSRRCRASNGCFQKRKKLRKRKRHRRHRRGIRRR
jgi:hypothetical protein